MQLSHPILAAVFGLIACGADLPETARTARPAIYGSDARVDAANHPNPDLRSKAVASAVAIVRRAEAPELELGWPDLPTLDGLLGLCPGEAFAEQPVLATCSGVLVGPQEVLTARHCIPSAEVCRESLFVFGYNLEDDALAPLDAANVHTCAGIVGGSDDEDRAGDFVVVRLQRPAAPHQIPLELRPSDAGPMQAGDPVVVFGYPSGLPLKIDDGGRVHQGPPERTTYQISSDTFGGSSGSAVLDAAGRLAGIISGGLDDYEMVEGCVRTLRWAEEDAAEEAVPLDGLGALLVGPDEVGGCVCTGRSPASAPTRLTWALGLGLFGALAKNRVRVAPKCRSRPGACGRTATSHPGLINFVRRWVFLGLRRKNGVDGRGG